MRTRALWMVVLVVAMVALTACGGGTGGTLKIAILAPLSGDVATFGESTRDGALLAIEEWNAEGGVLGMQIETVIGIASAVLRRLSARPIRSLTRKA